MIRICLFFVKNKVLENKKYFFMNTFLLVIVLFLLMTTFSFSLFIKKFVKTNYDYNYQYKKLFVSYDEDIYTEEQAIEFISKFPNIDLVSSQDEFWLTVKADINNNGTFSSKIQLVSCNKKTAPRTFNGVEILENSIIIPNNFKPYGYRESMSGMDLIGKKIKIQYNIIDYTPYEDGGTIFHGGRIIGTKEFDFKVIGTYDADEYFESNDSCYVLNSDLYMLSSENVKYEDNAIFSGLVVICDYYDNVENVISNLNENGMYEKKAANFNTDFIDIIIIFGYLLSTVFAIVSIATTCSSLKIDLNKNKIEYALLKCIGYKDKDLFYIMMSEQVLISFISFVVSYFIASFTIYEIQKYFIYCFDVIGNYTIRLTFNAIIIGIIICFVLPLLVILLYSIKLHKISPIETNK